MTDQKIDRRKVAGLLPGIQWDDFPNVAPRTYTFVAGLIYEDTYAQRFLLCLETHTLSYPNYPVVGAKFFLIRVPTLAFAEKIRTDLTTALANAPAKLPRYYGTNSAGQQFTGDTLNSVAGSVGNYGGRIQVNVNGTLTGGATVRYGNILYGNGYKLDLAGFSLSLARDATITDYSLSNGMLSLYGTGGHTLHNTSLHNVGVEGAGGQAVTLTNCALSCDPGFVLFRDGISVTLVGTAGTPNPAVPANAVVPAGVTVTVIPYTPAGPGAANSPHPAPAFVAQDNDLNTFTVAPPLHYRFAEIEYSLDVTAVTPTAVTSTMVVGTNLVLAVGNFDRPAGRVGFRTRTGGGRAQSEWVTNPQDFTAAGNVAPAGLMPAPAANFDSNTGYYGASGDWVIANGLATSNAGGSFIYNNSDVSLAAGGLYNLFVSIKSITGGLTIKLNRNSTYDSTGTNVRVFNTPGNYIIPFTAAQGEQLVIINDYGIIELEYVQIAAR